MRVLRECKAALRELPLTKFDDKTEELINHAIIYLDMVIRDREKTVEAIREAQRAELEG